MKNDISTIAWFTINDKLVLIIGNKYKGEPTIMCEYDVLVCSEVSYIKYQEELIAKHLTKKGWKPNVRFI